MRSQYFKYIILFSFVFILCFLSQDIWAQCPMCRSAAESNLKAGGGSARGLNAGILYMLCAPYILVGTLGFLWWRKNGRQLVAKGLE